MTDPNQTSVPLPDDERIKRMEEAEAQILENERVVNYDTKEYPVETIVEKYLTGKEDDQNELFVPDYQRDFTWPEDQQSKFIESVLIGLPIPYIFVADVDAKEGRIEIVDGSQRIRTLANFLTNGLVLRDLKKLTLLNGKTFSDLHESRKRRFRRRSLRMIELNNRADEAVRRDMFERINTGSKDLEYMDVQWGVHGGELLQFIEECSKHPLFVKLAPLSAAAIRRREHQEFVLRFFAYLENYRNFDRFVNKFLDEYFTSTQSVFNAAKKTAMKEEFEGMLAFVDGNIPHGFKKSSGHTRTPRIRFEAISVGSALALRVKPNLTGVDASWLESPEFKQLTTSDASNSRPKVIRRIEYVRDKLLG